MVCIEAVDYSVIVNNDLEDLLFPEEVYFKENLYHLIFLFCVLNEDGISTTFLFT